MLYKINNFMKLVLRPLTTTLPPCPTTPRPPCPHRTTTPPPCMPTTLPPCPQTSQPTEPPIKGILIQFCYLYFHCHHNECYTN